MKVRARAGVTPQGKLISVNKSYGNQSLKKQQGTTREIYDSILLDPSNTMYEFFANTSNKVFPFTNLSENTLQPQESLVVERAYWSLVTYADVAGTPGAIIEIVPLIIFNHPGLSNGEISMDVATKTVMKPIPVASWLPEFNDNESQVSTVKEFDTDIIIPPLLNFQFNLKVRPNFFTPIQGQLTFLKLTIGGVGAIFNPTDNF